MQSTKIGKFTVYYEQSEEFHTVKREVFTHDSYYVELDTDEPVIIDAGAHIGLSTLYFKRFYPQAKIWAVEPIPDNFRLLEQNVFENQLSDVALINAALSDTAGRAVLHQDSSGHHWHSTASRFAGAWNGAQKTIPIEVPALLLSDLLYEINQPIDLLKMDIEGSELAVLKEAEPRLGQVLQLLIEYHPRPEQPIDAIIILLQHHGFTLEFWQNGRSVEPHRTKGLLYIQAKSKK